MSTTETPTVSDVLDEAFTNGALDDKEARRRAVIAARNTLGDSIRAIAGYIADNPHHHPETRQAMGGAGKLLVVLDRHLEIEAAIL